MENSAYEGAPSPPSDLQRALEEFDLKTQPITNMLRLNVETHPLPHTMYHYTTDAGLRGILQSGKFWLTDIFALNDPSELRHGLSLAIDVLDAKVKDANRPCQLFAKAFKAALTEGIQKSAHYFSCSFSKHGDDLGQWRAYADDGRGYCLEFETLSLKTEFANAARTETSNGEGFSITYNDSELIKVHGEVIAALLPLASLPANKHLPEEVFESYWTRLLTRFAVHVLHASLYFKHMSYDNEKEYRFLEIHGGNVQPTVKFRPRGYELIKYREFDWRSADADVLKKIVVGPAADFEKSRAFAERCLEDFGFKNVEIVRSHIPYRTSNQYPR
ncbi:MAG: DUF2971 domain-containing protein [Acidobacteriaceae bacterium]